MKRYLLAAAAVLPLSTGSVLAAGSDAGTAATQASPPVATANGYYGYYSSGYLFPNDGSPSGDQPMARPSPPQQASGIFSRVYLYPPAEGSDTGGGAS